MALRIRLFGDLEVRRGNQLLATFPTRDAEGLFCFLALHNGQTFSRDVLARKLFPDCNNESKRIRNAIWRARQLVDQKENESLIRTDNRRIGLQLHDSGWVDVQAFETVVAEFSTQESLETEQVQRLEQAIDLYRGDLLEERDDDWCFCIRERLKLKMLTAIERVMVFFATKNDWNKAICHAHLLLQHDPLREHIHRELMGLYYQVGDRPAAIVQYASCAKLLRQELDIEPMRETQALLQQIMSESISRRNCRSESAIPNPRLARVLACLDEARAHLSGHH